MLATTMDTTRRTRLTRFMPVLEMKLLGTLAPTVRTRLDRTLTILDERWSRNLLTRSATHACVLYAIQVREKSVWKGTPNIEEIQALLNIGAQG